MVLLCRVRCSTTIHKCNCGTTRTRRWWGNQTTCGPRLLSYDSCTRKEL